MADWATDFPRNIASRYVNALLAASGVSTSFDPANPVFHGTGTTNAILNSTCVGPSAQVTTGGDSAFGFAAQVTNGGLALGQGANSFGQGAIAMQSAQALGDGSFAWGLGTVANGQESQACGNGAQTGAFGQLCFGRNATAVTGSEGAIAVGDAAIVGANNGASCAFGSGCQIGDDGGHSCAFGPNNITQASAGDNTICGSGNSVNSGCQLSRIFGSANVIGSGSSNNTIVGQGNTLADSSTRNVIITDSFSTSGTLLTQTTIIGNDSICTKDRSACMGASTSSVVANGLALGFNANAADYISGISSPLALGVDTTCLPPIADVFVPTNYLVININGTNWKLRVQQE